MVEGGKRKKFHDKDKYYRLAKEQGYRSRAAFKLTQINRKFHFLESAKVVIDLCAAPGGWTQVASRTMLTKSSGSSSGTILVAVDILPIRPIPNVISIIGDITTEKCKAQIKAQLQTAMADVVLCDGAPNVGASYDRDAYQQNEIALHALKCATQHLKRNGTFVTKIYRSSDYSSYVWVVKQLFEQVQAVKPNASRSQSAEIFLVCTGYLDPTSIDPRMLDPKCVFEQVDGAATGGGDAAQKNASVGGNGGITIFHKKFNDKRRSRQGYDMDVLDATMRNIGSVADFIESSGSGVHLAQQGQGGTNKKDPIQMLSFCTGLSFTCHLCKAKEEQKRKGEDDVDADMPECNCEFYLHHKLTTPEIKECVADLKVLNKADFKALLTWRERIKKSMEAADEDEDDEDGDSNVKRKSKSAKHEEDLDSDAEEDRIQNEIEQLRAKKLREQKKLKKKERELQAKRRKRAALGMDLNAIEVPEQESMFSLTAISSAKDLEVAREVDLGKVTDEQIFVEEEKEEDEDVVKNEHGEIIAQGEQDDIDEDTGYNYRLDRELDAAYERYLTNTKNKAAKIGTKSAKRSKREMRLKAAEQAKEDEELMMDDDTKKYAEMLQGPKDSDEDSSDEEEEGVSSDDDDGFRSVPVTPSEHEKIVAAKKKKAKKVEEMNPLIHRLVDESSSVKTARWFSNPLFENIGMAASLATMSTNKQPASALKDADDYDQDTDDDVEELSSDDEEYSRSRKRKKSERKSNRSAGSDEESNEEPLTADSVLAMMPKTDKQVRHEKRLKAMERKERREKRRARLAGEMDSGFEVVEGEEDNEDDLSKKDLDGLSEKEKKKVLEARELIKAGLGQRTEVESEGFEVVSAEKSKEKSLLPVLDQREYNSENEAYDSDDYAETLALGTMMLRQSKAKSLVDASYNRFAWNDPEDLPEWFLDDENKNYRPQLPIPQELLVKMKERFMSLATRPIAKVAEARARKNKRARVKLAAAKKKAEAVANSSEMSEAMKLKAISKAMRGNDASRPSKTYVVSKKGGGTKGGKGLKLVDKRMKNDKRAMDRATKKRKAGKKGGLTGSKRRRHHS